MAALIRLISVLIIGYCAGSLIFNSEDSDDTPYPQCECYKNVCTCCRHIDIPGNAFLSGFPVCVVLRLQEDRKIKVSLTVMSMPVLSKVIDQDTPEPLICTSTSDVGIKLPAKICVEVNNITWVDKNKARGCLDVTASVDKEKTREHLGCFVLSPE